MARRIKITAGGVTGFATLKDNATADKIWEALPIDARGQTWGDEVYFGVPVDCGGEAPQATVAKGDLGYWEPGSAFCIFFGPTPVSVGDEIRPADPVTVFGALEGDPTAFRAVRSGAKVRVERAE